MTPRQSRRNFLQCTAAVPILAWGASSRTAGAPRLICEPNCLSQESAAGFDSILRQTASMNASAIVLAAASAVTTGEVFDLYDHALSGAWVIWESSPVACNHREQARMVREKFGVWFSEPVPATELYVRFSWPRATLTRTFLAAAPVACAAGEAIARCGDVAVAARRRIGKGGIILLGAMLGPNVRAGEREATQITTEMFRLLRA